MATPTQIAVISVAQHDGTAPDAGSYTLQVMDVGPPTDGVYTLPGIGVAPGALVVPISPVSSLLPTASLSVETIGEEPIIIATGNNTVSVTISSGTYAGTYTERATDNAPLTVAMIETAPTPVLLPEVTGNMGIGDTLTITPGLWIYDGPDPGDQTWQQQLDGSDIPGGTGLSYVIEAADAGKSFAVAETFGGVTAQSVGTNLVAAPAFDGPADLGAKLHTWLDFTDAGQLYENQARTNPVDGAGDFINGITDKSGNGRHYQIAGGLNSIAWDAANTQADATAVDGFGAWDADTPLDGATSTMEIYIAVKTTDTRGLLMSNTTQNNEIAGWFIQGSTGTDLVRGAGSNTVVKINGAAFAGATRGDLYTSLATGSGVVFSAEGLDLTLWQSAGLRLRFMNWANRSFGDDVQGTYTHILITQQLTPTERASVQAWLQGEVPV